jgi:hypothetical protein
MPVRFITPGDLRYGFFYVIGMTLIGIVGMSFLNTEKGKHAAEAQVSARVCDYVCVRVRYGGAAGYRTSFGRQFTLQGPVADGSDTDTGSKHETLHLARQ